MRLGLQAPPGMDDEVPLPVLGAVGLRCGDMLLETARSKEMLIYAGSINAGSINREHVHMRIGIPPQLSV